MPYLKFSRDKHGYENYFLIEPPPPGREQRGKGRSRVLFWFRTPPHIKVGRLPFSDEVRRMVEAQNPGLAFDWARIVATPIPPPDEDHWRERRRAEKAARRAARTVEAGDADAAADEAHAEPAPVIAEATSQHDEVAIDQAIETAGSPHAGADDVPAEGAAPTSDSQARSSQEHRRRRRRRRGRHGHPGGATVQAGPQPTDETASTQQDTTPASGMPPSDEV